METRQVHGEPLRIHDAELRVAPGRVARRGSDLDACAGDDKRGREGLEGRTAFRRRLLPLALPVRFLNPRPAEWPEVDFVVGNPPFIGTKRMRALLGDGYVDALRSSYSDDVEDNADFVMYWWHKAASLVEQGAVRQFGLITTNSLTQTFNRRVVARHLGKGVSVAWAIPDHPWADTETGAAVRIAMTVAARTEAVPFARLAVVATEEASDDAAGAATLTFDVRSGAVLHEDLRLGANVAGVKARRSNDGLAGMGVALHGAGFLLEPTDAAHLRKSEDDKTIRPFVSGRDLMQEQRERYIIDFSFLDEDTARRANPAAFQVLIDKVFPERRENRRASIRRLWWRFGWERPEIRAALHSLDAFIATPETSKHRVFQFVSARFLPEHRLVVIASGDPFVLGVLSSRVHVTWSLAAGGTLEDRPVYNKTRCFDPFAFPAPTSASRSRISQLGAQLDGHRKRQQALYPELTITGMYNVLEKLRSGEALTAKDKIIHEQGLVSILKQIHDDLDAAVFDAYGWPSTLTDEEILERLVALNAERAEEERNGLVRWLRPDFQNPGGQVPDEQTAFSSGDTSAPSVTPGTAARPWPKALPERIASVRDLLQPGGEWTLGRVKAAFSGAKPKELTAVLESLATLGLLRQVESADGTLWAAAARPSSSNVGAS